MKNDKLILFTRRFPYHKTESFLESEIGILSSQFKEVIIFPTETADYKREVPANVSINLSLSKEFSKKNKRVVVTLFSLPFWKALLDNKREIKSIKDVKVVFQFITRVIAYNWAIKKQNSYLNNAIIYTYWFSELTFSTLKLKEEFKLNAKVVSRAHRYDLYEGGKDFLSFWPYRKYCLSKIDRLFSISDDGKNFLRNRYKVDSNIFVSRLGVLDKGFLAKKSGKDSITILSVSRIEKLKRVDLIMNSVIKFAEECPNVKIQWFHFGTGSQFDTIYEKSKSVDIANLSINIMGHVKNETIYDFYKRNPSDVFINLSSSEGIPVSIMEAHSFGIPVIATNVGGSGEIVNQNNGVLLDANPSVEEVCNALKNITNAHFNSDNIKAQWYEKYNASTNFSEFASSLKELAC